jgi:universal stress protein E
LHIVHAWRMFGEKMVRSHPQVVAADFERWMHEEHLAHQQRLNELLDQHPLGKIPHEIHLVKGEAATVIPQLAHERQVDLVVMGTVCRTGIAGFFIGNTAERVLHQLGCSVLTVKPEGFISPIPLESFYPEPVMFAP